MKSKLLRVLALVLTFAMLLSLAACKPKKKPNKKPAASEVIDNNFNSDIGQIDDIIYPDYNQNDVFVPDTSLPDDYGTGDINQTQIVISRPVGDLGISTGIKVDYTDGSEEEEIGEEIEDDEFEDIEEEEETTFVSPVSKYGTPVKNDYRVFNVDNTDNGIFNTDFQSLGCNVFPTLFTVTSQKEAGENIAYIELNAKRFNDISPAYARSWFQIDWMITDYAGEDYKKYENDPENNPDYIAYSKGEYDFENQYMQSCIEYWRMLGEADIRIELAFGWKVSERIQSWFSEDPSRPRISAPKDLDQYADAAKELLIYCYEQGLRNVDILSYYNEPHRVENSSWHDSWDYATLGDKRVYWGQMATLARKELDSDERTQNIEIWGTEPAGTVAIINEEYMNVYLYKYYSDVIDVFTFHEYYAGHSSGVYSEGFYGGFYDALAVARGHYKDATLAVTEFFAADRDVPETIWGYNWYKFGGWNSSYTSYLIALANNGWHVGLSWGFVGGFVPKPTFFMVGEGEHVAWSYPHSIESSEIVHYNFYHISMLNNYVPAHANVHTLTYEGEDLHASAFTSEDGEDFSLLVEKNEGGNALEFKVNLKKSLGGRNINVYRFVYEESTRNTDRNIQATIPQLYDTISNVNKTFSYKEDGTAKGRYAIYIFSTLEPLAQVELYNADNGDQAVATKLDINKNKSITINPELVDCDSADIEWEIKEYSVLPASEKDGQIDKTEIKNADLGTLKTDGNNVTYTVASDVKHGDVIALRATIKGTNRFASAMIEIVKEDNEE